MLVDIYTLHNAYNYGAFLQAYAMQETLRGLNAEPRFRTAPSVSNVSEKAYGGRLRKLLLILRALRNPRMALHYFIRNLRMRRSCKLLAGPSKEKAELCLIGSDEVWNTRNERVGYVPEFFGVGLNCPHVSAYAVSGGPPEDLLPDGAADGIRSMELFGARDNAAKRLYEAVSGNSCAVVLDPVFLYDFTPLCPEAKIGRRYLLVYGKFTDRDVIEAVRRYATSRGLITISAGIYNSWCSRNCAAAPFGFLSLLRGADGVVTNTFHGTAFSIIFGKPAAVLPQSEKVHDLIELAGIQNARCNSPAHIAGALSRPAADLRALAVLKYRRETSLAFLKQVLACAGENR